MQILSKAWLLDGLWEKEESTEHTFSFWKLKHKASVCTPVVSRVCTGSHPLSWALACVLQMAGMHAHSSVAPGCVPLLPSPLQPQLFLAPGSFLPTSWSTSACTSAFPQMFYPQFLSTFLSPASHSSVLYPFWKWSGINEAVRTGTLTTEGTTASTLQDSGWQLIRSMEVQANSHRIIMITTN